MEIMGAIDFGVVIRFSPSDPDCDCSMRLHQGHFLPPSIVCWNCLCQVITEILVLSQAAVSIVIGVVVSAVSDFCFHIDPRNSVFKVVFIFDVTETLIQLFLRLDFVRKFAHITLQFEIEFFFLDLAHLSKTYVPLLRRWNSIKLGEPRQTSHTILSRGKLK